MTFLVLSLAVVLGEQNKCHQALGMENTRFNKLNSGAHARDTQNGPVYTLTAIVLFFSHQEADIQNIQEIWLPFQTSNLDLFPQDTVFI